MVNDDCPLLGAEAVIHCANGVRLNFLDHGWVARRFEMNFPVKHLENSVLAPA